MIDATILIVNKPQKITSQKVVSAVKKKFSIKKVGHLGTLDPFASGVLPIFIGGATKLADYLMNGKKGYQFEIEFGKETDTLDIEGVVVGEAPFCSDIFLRIQDVIPCFVGEIEQIPPAYSALKFNGKPLYHYMREYGELPLDIDLKKRKVTVDSLIFESARIVDDKYIAKFSCICSKGTYIRSLARDIAIKLGTLGYCYSLKRFMVEPWSLNDSVSFDELNELDVGILSEKFKSIFEIPLLNKPLIMSEKYEDKFSFGNSVSLMIDDCVYYDSDSVFDDLVDETDRLVRCGNVCFMSHVAKNGEILRIQPKKRIF